jgi:hypothetical protein
VPDTNWQLFIDESGDFDDPDDVVCVAGLFVPLPADDDLEPYLRTRLDEAFPLTTYPQHAAELDVPISRALLALRSPRLEGEPAAVADVRARIAPAIGALLGADDPEVLTTVGAHRVGVPLTHDRVRWLDIWLRGAAPEAHRELRAVCDEQEEALRAHVLGDLADLVRRYTTEVLPPSDGNPLPARPVALVAAEASPEGAGPPAARYLALFELLLERVYAHLREPGGARHHVLVRTSARDLRFGDATNDHRLDAPDVVRASRRAAGFPFLPAEHLPDRRVWLSALATESFGPAMHPGLVLADYVANRARRALKSTPIRSMPLAALQQSIERRLGHVDTRLPLRARPTLGPLPTVAAGGLARRHVRTCFVGRVAPEPLHHVPRWASESAQAWEIAARALAAEGAWSR